MATPRIWGSHARLTGPGTAILRPTTQDELVTAVRAGRHRHLRPIGSGHSFNDIASAPADSAALLLDRLNRVLAVRRYDIERPRPPMPATVGTVTVEAGITIDALLRELQSRNLTLVNVGAIREQTIAGALSTGTHGASIHVGSLSSLVVSLKLLRADGSVTTVTRDDAGHADLFRSACVGLGALGILLEVELEVVQALTLRPVRRMLTLDEFLAEGETIARTHPYARFYYFPYTDHVECVTDIPTDDPIAPQGLSHSLQRWVRGTLLDRHLAGALFTAASTVRPRQSIPAAIRLAASSRESGTGPADISWRCLTLPDLPPRHIEMEWSVPLQDWRAAVRALHTTIGPRPTPAFLAGFVISLRFVGSDGDIPLSNNYRRESLTIDIMQFHALDPYPYFAATTRAIRTATTEARPHWGKYFDLTAADLAPRYPEFEVFEQVRAAQDPDGVFTNPWLTRVLGS
ncbi:D-arabinono-1,4-lactone oxidase [Nocardia huaxiensis]|uniref:D-arabinono-1,4-lactone oxidase n=1 Tax=Nocardia huaxiensis TaxID=2755382 RepID=UPI001E64B568|nr:D-arabinono-1,4-lactone oxidase [Nocardia huaxiensis]UFS95921.1 FAD-binding protein [Nocardia huaxiensis]